MDFAFSYDYDLYVNETTKLGLLRSYSFNMLHSHFKGKEFSSTWVFTPPEKLEILTFKWSVFLTSNFFL